MGDALKAIALLQRATLLQLRALDLPDPTDRVVTQVASVKLEVEAVRLLEGAAGANVSTETPE